MSGFFANHPVSHVFVINVVLIVYVSMFLAAVATAHDIPRVPRPLWLASGRSRRVWIVASVLACLVYPVGLIVGLEIGHNALYLGLLGLGVSAPWWLLTRRRLMRLATEHVPWPVRPASPLFAATYTMTGKAFRVVVVVVAILGFNAALMNVTYWSAGDPTSVYITKLNHDIQPRPYIASKCPGTVVRVLHLSPKDPQIPGHSYDYQRWTVVPFSGHLDEVFLNTETGDVICP